MKRLFSFVLCLALCLSLLSPFASAAEKGKISFSADLATPIQGMTFTGHVELNRNPGVVSLITTLVFDPKVMEVKSVQDTGLLPGFHYTLEEGKVILQWKSEDDRVDMTRTGNLARVDLHIRDDAPYGGTRIIPQVSQKLLDARNAKGETVLFACQSLDLTLSCPHAKTQLQEITPPDFALAGLGTVTCEDCGESWEEAILPSLVSEDGKTRGFVQPGQYSAEDEKGLRTDYLYGGADFASAKELFGFDLIRVFRVTWIKNQEIFDPAGKTPIQVTAEFDLPADFVLYVLEDGGAKKVDCEWKGNVLYFDHHNAAFVLVSREVELPQVTKPAITTEPPLSSVVPLTPEEVAKRKEMLTLGLGGTAFVLFGGTALILLRKGRRE